LGVKGYERAKKKFNITEMMDKIFHLFDDILSRKLIHELSGKTC